jgi:hypothetical protein
LPNGRLIVLPAAWARLGLGLIKETTPRIGAEMKAAAIAEVKSLFMIDTKKLK